MKQPFASWSYCLFFLVFYITLERTDFTRVYLHVEAF